MKKQSISLICAFVSVLCITATTPLYSLYRGKSITSTRENSTVKAYKLDRIQFWNAVVKALKKDGYATDSAELQHAQRYLQRAQARQEISRTRESTAKTARAHKNGKSSTAEQQKNKTKKQANRQTTRQTTQ